MEHHVRVGARIVAAHEAACLEMVGRAGPSSRQPLHADPRAAPLGQHRRHRDGLCAPVLDVHLEVVLHVLAHTHEIMHHVDAERSELGRVADARELEELRRVERAAAADDLSAECALHDSAPSGDVLDSDCTRSVEDDLRRERARTNVEIGTVHHRVEVRARRAEAPSALDVAVEAGETLLAVAVDIIGQLVARLLHGTEEGVAEGIRGGPALDYQRSVAAAVLVGAGDAGLHSLEVREAVRVRPLFHARIGRPTLVVEWVAALEDHSVDAARAAEHLAARVVDAAAVHEGLRLRFVLPVVEAITDGERQGGRHVDEHVESVVGTAGFEHEHARRRILAQAIRKHAAGGPAADNDEVVPAHPSVRVVAAIF